MKRWVTVALLPLLLVLGCGAPDVGRIIEQQFPTIGKIVIDRAIHDSPITFSVETIAPESDESNLFVSEVVVSYRSTGAPSLPFIESGELTTGSTSGDVTTWAGTLPALQLGGYELRVQPRVKYEPQSPDQPPVEEQPGLLMERTLLFWVGPDESCFGFAVDTEGWTVDGIFDIHETDENPDGVLNTLPLQCAVLLHLNGAALLPIGSNCFPSLPTEPASGNWALDYVSPDLTDLEPWQTLETVIFSIGADTSVQVQPILKVVDAAGEPHTYAPANGQDNWIFYAVDSGGRVIEWAPPVPEGGTITEFRVRVFTNPISSAGSPNIYCRLSAVCPTGP